MGHWAQEAPGAEGKNSSPQLPHPHAHSLSFLVRYCIKIKLTLIKILVGIAIMV